MKKTTVFGKADFMCQCVFSENQSCVPHA